MAVDSLIPPSLRASKSFLSIMQSLLSLSADQLNTMADAVATRDGFRPDTATLTRLRTSLQQAAPELVEVLSVCGFLYDVVLGSELTEGDLVRELQQLGENLEVDITPDKVEALRNLFKPNAEYNRYRRRRSAAEELMPLIEQVSLRCDLRPVTSAPGRIDGYVPVVVARLDLDEPIGGQIAIVVQVPDAALAELQAELDSVRQILSAIKEELGERVI